MRNIAAGREIPPLANTILLTSLTPPYHRNCAEVKIKRDKSKEDKKKKQSEKTSGSSADKFARGNKKKDKPDKKRKKPDKRKKPGKEDRQKDKKKRPGKRKNSPKKKRDEDKHNMRKPMYPTEHGMKRGIAR